MNHGSVHSFVHGLESHSDHLKLSLIMFYLNMLDYTVFFPMLSTLTWDTLLTLRSTWGFYLNHLIPLRPFKSVFDNVLLEHGELPHVLPLAVHLILLGLGLEDLGFGTRLDNRFHPKGLYLSHWARYCIQIQMS